MSTTTNASALARLAVHDVMHRYAWAVDSKDWGLLRGCFCSPLRADFRSFGAKAVFSGSAEEWVENVRQTISGMEATQHLMANHLYRLDLGPDGLGRARGTTYIQALHRCRNDWGGDVYTIGGHYQVEMRELPEPGSAGTEWRIERYAINVSWHAGDRHVLRAARRAR